MVNRCFSFTDTHIKYFRFVVLLFHLFFSYFIFSFLHRLSYCYSYWIILLCCFLSVCQKSFHLSQHIALAIHLPEKLGCDSASSLNLSPAVNKPPAPHGSRLAPSIHYMDEPACLILFLILVGCWPLLWVVFYLSFCLHQDFVLLFHFIFIGCVSCHSLSFCFSLCRLSALS